MDYKLSTCTHVSPPRPIEVKKLMANLVFFGLSRGRRPSNAEASSLVWGVVIARGGTYYDKIVQYSIYKHSDLCKCQ